jgi:hypothetical protein
MFSALPAVRALTVLPAAVSALVLSGCAPREVSISELRSMAHGLPTDHCAYLGTSGKYHHVRRVLGKTGRRFRVLADSLQLDKTFPLGARRSYVLLPPIIDDAVDCEVHRTSARAALTALDSDDPSALADALSSLGNRFVECSKCTCWRNVKTRLVEVLRQSRDPGVLRAAILASRHRAMDLANDPNTIAALRAAIRTYNESKMAQHKRDTFSIVESQGRLFVRHSTAIPPAVE